MPEQPDEATLQQIHDVARQLAERRGLSDDEAEEICGHLEDKLLAYMRGEVPITREDALLLARAHFGDAVGISRQLACELHPIRPELRRHRALVKTAIFTGATTLVGLPCTLLLVDQVAGSLRDVLMAGMVLLGCLAVLESGVLLGALTDPHSRWQRAVAAGFTLPALAILYMALAGGVHALNANWQLPTQGRYAVIVAIELTCLFGHVFLLVLLALPVQGSTDDAGELPAAIA